jgi:hypothetical protein
VQETFEVWGGLFQTSMSTDDILALCVGDTFDAPNRSAFPPTKLIAVPDGQQMFDIARAALTLARPSASAAFWAAVGPTRPSDRREAARDRACRRRSANLSDSPPRSTS